MEVVGVIRDFWRGRRVFLTGHTGFKGGWLALWLADMGAEVWGYSLPPEDGPSFYAACNVGACIADSTFGDVRDPDAILDAIAGARPECMFHLAAQSLVLGGYDDPVGTYATNVMGTVNLLEAARKVDGIAAIVSVTTDKCYDNPETDVPFTEDAPLGGADPYSSSKAAAELVSAAYRRSFLNAEGVGVATARAGNVIGGGDWSANRLLPDFFRSLERGEELVLRSPEATRPWQHVLEPLSGYLTLAEALASNRDHVAGAYNFGPDDRDARPVQWIAEHLAERIEGARWRTERRPDQPHEAHYLRLDSGKATRDLGWTPRWNLEQAIDRTIAWQEAWRDGADMSGVSIDQIHAYEATA